MLFDDAVTYAESQAGSFADFFRGKKRLEHFAPVGLLYSASGIDEFDLYGGTFDKGSRYFELSGDVAFGHRVVGVVDEVQEDLLHLVRIHGYKGRESFVISYDLNAVDRQLIVPVLESAVDDLVDVHFLFLERCLASERQESAHDFSRAINAKQYFSQHPPVLFRQ